MPRDFYRECLTQEFIFDQELIAVNIGELLFGLDNGHVLDNESDVGGEVDMEARKTLTKEKSMVCFDMDTMDTMLWLSKTLICTILYLSLQVLLPIFGCSNS